MMFAHLCMTSAKARKSARFQNTVHAPFMASRISCQMGFSGPDWPSVCA